ncbi:MAG: ABC1 kinase family protein, partial [Ktedonobacterales bacterium]
MSAPEVSVAASRRRVGRSNRYRQIIEILVRHGFGFVVGKTGWNNQRITRLLKSDSAEAHAVGTPERLRLVLEDLGPTFIKLGQILSTRGDLLPASYRAELAKLQDSAPPVASEQIRSTFAEEFGRSVDEVFSAFDMRPIAAASIGQAHAATLPDGSEVIVKLRRPHIIEDVEEDLRVLVDLSYLAARHWEMARYYDIVAIVAEFAQTLRAELDYLHEGRNLERIADNFAGDSSVHIP